MNTRVADSRSVAIENTTFNAATLIQATLAVALILMLPSIINGSPFIYFDAEQYLSVGRRIVDAMLDGGRDEIQTQGMSEVGGPVASSGGLAAIAGGRSPLYAVFLCTVSGSFGLWAIAIVQAFSCAALIVWFCRLSWSSLHWLRLLAIAATLSFGSGLGFFSAFITPDVFTGCLAVIITIFLFFKPTSTRANTLLIGSAFLASTLHTSNILLVVCGMVAAFLSCKITRTSLEGMRWRLTALGGIVVLAILFGAAYAAIVRSMSEDEIRSPPYLTARVLADGPGETYLAKHCTGTDKPFAACVFAGRDFTSQDNFLWEPSKGGFQAVDRATQLQLGEQDIQFALAAISENPLAQISSALVNFSRSLVANGLAEIDEGVKTFADAPEWRGAHILKITPGAEECVRSNTCAHPSFGPVWKIVVSYANALFLSFGLVMTLWFSFGGKALKHAMANERVAISCVIFLTLLTVANAAICGVLSGLHDRYQTRIIWALGLAIMAAAPTGYALVLKRTSSIV